MPIITNSSFGSGISRRGSVGEMAAQRGANYTVTQDRNAFAVGAGVLGLGAVDLADTVASSIPGLSSAFGIQRGDVNNKVFQSMDAPGLGDFYHDYKGGIEATSAVMGIVGSELIARRLTAPGSLFMGALSKVPYVRRVAALDAQYDRAMAAVRMADTNLAARGALGIEQFVGRSVIDFGEMAGKDASRRGLVWAAKATGFAKGARNAAVTEGIMGLTMNQNGFLYDDSAAHNIAWMAAGAGIGGAAEWIHGAYQMRKFVNSDEIRRTFANALDPEEFESGRLLWHGKGVKPDEEVSFLGGSITDKVTNLMVNARSLEEWRGAGTADDVARHANLSRLGTQWTTQANEELQKLTRKGISSDGRTRFSLGASPGYDNHLNMLLRRDPAAMYGVEQLGGVSAELPIRALDEAHVERLGQRLDQTDERIGELIDKGFDNLTEKETAELSFLQSRARRLEYEAKLTPMAVVDGEMMPLSEAEKFEGFVEPEVRFRADDRVKGAVKGEVKSAFKKGDEHGLFEARVGDGTKAGVSLDTGFIYHIPGKKNLDNADLYDVMRLYRLSNKALDKMARFTEAMPLPKNPDWFQLDMAEELLRRTNGRAKVVFPEGMTREGARIESLLQKSKVIQQWDKVGRANALRAEASGKTLEGQLSSLRLRYNLPRLSAYERGILGVEAEHPVEGLLRGMALMDEDAIRSMTLPDVQDAMGKFKRIGDMAPVLPSDIEDMGTSFRFMLDDKGNPLKPILAYKRPFEVAEWSKEHVAERLAANKMHAVATLTAEQAAPVTRAISQSITQSTDFDMAARTHELMDTQVAGSIVGSSPQTTMGQIGNAFRSTEMRDRDNPILLAATRVREQVNRMARDFMKASIESAFGDRLSVLANPRNASTKLLLNQFHSFRAGWDLAPAPVKRADGFNAFILRPTADNAERFKEQFGREMTKGQLLLGPDGKEIVLDDMALDIQNRLNQVTEMLRQEKNTLLRANGRKEIDSLPWYVPPPNTDNKFLGFVFDPQNNPVRGMTIVADTKEEFRAAQAALMKDIEKKGLGYTFRTQESIREFANIWDKVVMDFINPGTTAIQPGKLQRGRLVGNQIRLDAFEESLKYLQEGYLRHSNDILETLYKEQINSAGARALVASEVTASQARGAKDVKAPNIYDFYLENLLGRSKLNDRSSAVGRIYGAIETTLDKFLAESTPSAARVWEATNEWIGKRKVWDKSGQARKDFETLSQKLGKYMPFENAAKLAEARGYGATPPTVAGMVGKLNQFSAAVLLRMFEVIHPVMNLSGILNAAPAVIRNFQPRVGEGMEEFAARVGHVANIFENPVGKPIGVLDMNKVMKRGFEKAWSRESHPEYDYMVRRGFLSQEVAEFHRQFGAIESKSEWNKFFTGDEHAKGFKNKGVIGWLSIMSDKSEDFSRSWGHMVGLEVADNLGIKGMEARHTFAHDIANKMIANYSPHNRPEIFQGALGAPIGLFQSFVMNYYQRMFRYAETKDYRALATQVATQSGLFGVSSIPGWQQFNEFMTKNDGSEDPASGIYRKFGGNAGDLISHGLLSSLPALFGAPSADLYSRGDVSIRQLQISDPTSIPTILNSTVPAFNLMSKLYNGLTQGIGLFSERNPQLSSTQVAEVLSNAIANRPLAGLIEQFGAHGNDTDASGQLVNETHGMMETAYRLMGIRSMRQSRELEAFYANKNAMEHKAALDEQLSQHTRGLIRSGKTDAIPDVFRQYVENGGDPRNFRRWFKATYIAATDTRAQRQLEKAMKDPNKMDQVLRLLDAGVSVDDDENADPQRYVTGEPEPLTHGPELDG